MWPTYRNKANFLTLHTMYSQKTAVDEQNSSPYKYVIHHGENKTETQVVPAIGIMRGDHLTLWVIYIEDEGLWILNFFLPVYVNYWLMFWS